MIPGKMCQTSGEVTDYGERRNAMTEQPMRTGRTWSESDISGGPMLRLGARSSMARAADLLARLLGSAKPLSVEEAREALVALKAIDVALPPDLPDDPQGLAKQRNMQRYLFAGLPDTLSLEESVYKAWTTDPSHPLARRKGLAWGDPAAHMMEMLDRFGLMPDPQNSKPPDHIAVLLEFLSFLLETRPVGEAASFCADHLDWLPHLRAEAAAHGIAGVFLSLVLAAEQLADRISMQAMGDDHGRRAKGSNPSD
jgi:hypothetical protein